MVRGWVEHPGGRHHGAHGAAASRTLGVSVDAFLDYSQNINPLGPPPGAIDAARRAIHDETGRYPEPGYRELREALAEYLRVSPGRVLPTNGGTEALFLAARAAGRGGKALILEPTFSEYEAAARAAGFEPVRRVVRRRRDGFVPDLSALREAAGAALVFLCNPNNPTGDALSRDEVLRLAGRVWEGGGVLVVDEAFADFAPEVSVAAEADGSLYVARSFTKFFAVPGLRLGCLVCADPEDVQQYQPSWSVNAVAAAAGTAAVRDSAFIDASLAEVARLRRWLFEALEALPGVTPFEGAANFLLVHGPEGLSGRLARRGILVRGCGPFAGLGGRYFRVAVRGMLDNRRLVDAIGEEL